ncbi:hypothetical protein [Candidatus Tokpelaia sp.]|uniref:hypothetical protein n=1 Tax=Candidatus Tokpelaia sp. TaxID=2233777 RepID=UPI00167FEF81|nr:hypothetical protein [Candidatus Tokpelaia sp.]
MRYAKQSASSATKQTKKWQSYTEQINLLQQRGLIIDNDAAAAKALSSIGY